MNSRITSSDCFSAKPRTWLRRTVTTLLGGLLCCQLAACHRYRPLTALSGLEPLKPEVARVLINEVNAQAAEVQSLQAMGTLTVSRGFVRQKLSEVIVFERPSSLRVELFASEFNRLTAFLIVSGDRLEARELSEQRIYSGSATRENLARLLRLPFSPEEVMLWASGRFSVDTAAVQQYSVLANDQGTERVLRLLYHDGREILLRFRQGVERAACRYVCLESLEVRDAKRKKTLFFSEYEWLTSHAVPVPDVLNFQLPELSLEGELRFNDLSVNEDLAERRERLFNIQADQNPFAIDLDSVEVDPSLF